MHQQRLVDDSLLVSNPNGPPHPFQRRLAALHRKGGHRFKPQRAASSIPTAACRCEEQAAGGRFKPQRAASSIPTPSPNEGADPAVKVSNPNGPPHPFQRLPYAPKGCPLPFVSNPNGPPHPFQRSIASCAWNKT